MPPALETLELSRSFAGRPALERLTLSAAPGEVLAVLGPNGAGKTTTVRLLDGVLRPTSGSCRVLGIDPSVHGDAVRRRTGVLTENAGVDERLTARENLLVSARVRGMTAGDAARRAAALLERFGMGDRADRPLRGSSTGERKRVALARALLHDPEVLFLDEPTSGLDPAATREVVDLIARLAADHGRTIVLCTHFLAEAGRLAHRMAVLDQGRLLAFGRPHELAAQLWSGLEVSLDLGGPPADTTLAAVRKVPGVTAVAPTPEGARIAVTARAALPGVTVALVSAGVPVYAAVPHEPTLEDVYFAVQERAGVATGVVTAAPAAAAR